MIKYFLLVGILLLQSECKLLQVVSMFRHGARYPINSEYDANATSYFKGELSAVGMRQHQKLGQMLRRDYIDKLGFLSKEFKEGEFEAYTTDVNRTIQSVQSQFYGMYGLGQGQKLPPVDSKYLIPPYSMENNAEQNQYALPRGYRPIPIQINETIVLTVCKNYMKELNNNIQRQIDIYDEMNLTYHPFLLKMASIFDVPSESMDFKKISGLYDTLTVDKYLGRDMPGGNFTQDDYMNMKHLHEWYTFITISFDLSRTLNTGKLQRVISDFDDRIRNASKTLKWTFLSCHDVDMSAMLLDMNISSQKCIEQEYRKGKTSALNCDSNIDFAADVIFELHSDDAKKYHVRVRHNGKYVYLCGKKDVTCQYEEWKSRVMKILIDIDWVCNRNE